MTWARFLLLVTAAGLAACASEPKVEQIKDITGEEAVPPVPVVKTGPVQSDTDKALENYERLLDLPQDPATRAETLRRLADLQLESDEQGGESFEQSEARLRRSVALYTTLLTEHPDDPGNDRILYQLARAYQNLGETAKAEEALEKMTQKYPQSSFGDDAHFRRAELLFRLGEFDTAAAEYRHILNLKDGTPFYELAQYKYGWAMYKQSKYSEAVDTFIAILDRELPKGELNDVKSALEATAPGKKDMTQDALRVVSLALTNLGGGDAANRYFAGRPQPPYITLLYDSLGETLLEKKRYTDAARAYVAFVETHPRHHLAPVFMSKAIAAQESGGFAELVMTEKERYARTFDPSAAYWAGRPPSPEVLKALRGHLEDLARHRHAKAQKARAEPNATSAAGRADFLAAVQWYRKLLELFPQDPRAADLRFLMAESYFEAGETLPAATEYTRVATEYAGYARAPEAAYAALLAYYRRSTEVPPAERPAALRQSIDAGIKLAEKYPQHPQALAALTRAAEDLYQLQAWDEAIGVAARVLKAVPPAPENLRRTAWSVTADAQFSQKRYPETEAAYTELLRLTAPTAPERATYADRIATAIYKQGEKARTAGNLKLAADTFLRVGKAVPSAAIRATAEYDAAAMLITLKDWTAAAAVLEAFRTTHPASPLLPDVDKKLAVVYQSGNKPQDAATVLKRIAARSSETAEVRREAAWLAVTLLDQARDTKTVAEYEAYLKLFPQPLDRAQDARQRLATLADGSRRPYWLREIIAADAAAGAARTAHSKQLAAAATLELGRAEAETTAKIALRLPLKSSLPARKEAMQRAITTLQKAADYGVAEVTTAATYELGVLYQDLSRALLQSDRPKNLSALELEQYNLLLEEQAFPFEEKSIQWHEANLERVAQGVYNEWVGKSLQALAQIAPGKYGKREQTADVYDALR